MKLIYKITTPLIILLIMFLSISCDKIVNNPEEDIDTVIGQMLLIGFRGFEITAENPIYNDLTKYKIGGVVLYDRDVVTGTGERNIKSPDQLKALIKQIKEV